MTRPPIGVDQSRTIEARTDPWNVESAPNPKQAEAAKNAVEANRFLAEGEVELAAMLGMEEAKKQVKMIRRRPKSTPPARRSGFRCRSRRGTRCLLVRRAAARPRSPAR